MTALGDNWRAETFPVAQTSGAPIARSGYTRNGLGLASIGRGGWRLYHLGTGAVVGTLYGDHRMVEPVARELADAGDWDFLSLTGYRNHFPEMVETIVAWGDRHRAVVVVDETLAPPDDAATIQVARLR